MVPVSCVRCRSLIGNDEAVTMATYVALDPKAKIPKVHACQRCLEQLCQLPTVNGVAAPGVAPGATLAQQLVVIKGRKYLAVAESDEAS